MSGAIRMIKMFGWEDKIGDRIDQKRKEELDLWRKYQLFNLINHIL